MTQYSLNKYKKLLFLSSSIFLHCLVFSQKKEAQNLNVFENLVIENNPQPPPRNYSRPSLLYTAYRKYPISWSSHFEGGAGERGGTS